MVAASFASDESTFVTDDLAQCRCSVSLVTRCDFDVHLDVGTTRRPTKHGFSGIPVRFLSLMWERRASLEKTLSLFPTGARGARFAAAARPLDRTIDLKSQNKTTLVSVTLFFLSIIVPFTIPCRLHHLFGCSRCTLYRVQADIWVDTMHL